MKNEIKNQYSLRIFVSQSGKVSNIYEIANRKIRSVTFQYPLRKEEHLNFFNCMWKHLEMKKIREEEIQTTIEDESIILTIIDDEHAQGGKLLFVRFKDENEFNKIHASHDTTIITKDLVNGINPFWVSFPLCNLLKVDWI